MRRANRPVRFHCRSSSPCCASTAADIALRVLGCRRVSLPLQRDQFEVVEGHGVVARRWVLVHSYELLSRRHNSKGRPSVSRRLPILGSRSQDRVDSLCIPDSASENRPRNDGHCAAWEACFLVHATATPKLEVVALKSLASKSPFVHQAVTLRSHDSLTPGSQPPSQGIPARSSTSAQGSQTATRF